jgi:photosystem II stability/assembly factor-like uncharacterized protein
MSEKIDMKNFKKSITFIAFVFVFLASSVFSQSKTEKVFSNWQVIGPTGGDIRMLAIDPKNKSRLFITTLDSQVYKSEDAGKTWKHLVTLYRPQLTLDYIFVDSSDSNRIYVTGHRHKEPGGFFYSNDGGITWKESNDIKNEAIHSVTQSAINPAMFVAGASEKVYISMNFGETWKLAANNTPFANLLVDSVVVDPRDAKTIYAGTTHRAWKTKDGGETWKLIKDGMIDDTDVFGIDLNKENPDHIFANGCSGIYESLNGGEKWTKIPGIPSSSRRTKALLRNPTDKNQVYAGTTEGFWLSSNGGKTWALTTQRELEVNSISVHPDEPNKVYIATNNYGLMVSVDGGKNFAISNGNLTSRFMMNITADIQRPNRFYATSKNTATGGGFFFVSDDSGITWKPSVQNLSVIRTVPFTFLQDTVSPNTLYLGTNIGMYQSLDRGNSWIQLKTPKIIPAKKVVAKKGKKSAKPAVVVAGIKRVGGFTDTVNLLAYANDGKNGMFAATNNGLFRTNNINGGWDKFSLGVGIDDRIFSVASSAKMPQRIFAGTTNSGLVVSEDSGLTWNKVATLPVLVPVVEIEIDPQDENLIYVGTKQALYVSRDGGKNWLRRNDLPPGSYNSILINPLKSSEVFAASSLEGSGGIFQSVDSGRSWKRLDDRDLVLPTRRIWGLSMDPKNNNRILVATHSSGIYAIERTETTVATEIESRPRIAGNK